MDIWKSEIMAIIHGLFSNPSTRAEEIILAGAATIACIIALRLMSSAFGLKRNEWWRIVFVFVTTTALALAAVAAARIYLLGTIASPALRLGLQIGVAVLVVLIVGIPLQLLLQSGTYLESLLAFATTLFVTALITAGVYTAYHALKAGGVQVERAKERNKETRAETEGLTP